jgi:ElaB/YqjD/DUF883 family membrane-anchored ribosome-binding protein
MENEDLIREQMEETRTSLAEKVEILEQKIVSTVQETTAAVTDTVTTVKDTVQESVESVKETVQESVETAKETVKHWLDIRAHVEDHPWGMLGGSMLVGFIAGGLLSERSGYARGYTPSAVAAPQKQQSHHNGGTVRRQSEPAQPSWLSQFEPELNKLKGLALGAALGTIREMISAEVPQNIGSRVREVIDDVTKKLGGEPIPSSDWAGCPLAESSRQSSQESEETNMGQSEMQETASRPGFSHEKRFSTS